MPKRAKVAVQVQADQTDTPTVVPIVALNTFSYDEDSKTFRFGDNSITLDAIRNGLNEGGEEFEKFFVYEFGYGMKQSQQDSYANVKAKAVAEGKVESEQNRLCNEAADERWRKAQTGTLGLRDTGPRIPLDFRMARDKAKVFLIAQCEKNGEPVPKGKSLTSKLNALVNAKPKFLEMARREIAELREMGIEPETSDEDEAA